MAGGISESGIGLEHAPAHANRSDRKARRTCRPLTRSRRPAQCQDPRQCLGAGSRITWRATSRRTSAWYVAPNTRARLSISLDYCPDKDGHVIADIDYQGSGDNAAASLTSTGGYSVNISAKGQSKAKVDEQALLTRVDHDLRVESSTRGGEGSRREDVRSAYELSRSDLAPNTSAPLAVSQATSREGQAQRIQREPATAASIALLAGCVFRPIAAMFDQAQAKWRSGACLELIVRAPIKAGGAPMHAA